MDSILPMVYALNASGKDLVIFSLLIYSNESREKSIETAKLDLEKFRVKESLIETIETLDVKKEAIEIESWVKKVQEVPRCISCSKKVGLLGFKCHCERLFCRNHRMPESHACTFDFVAIAKEKLAKENIVVKAEKVIRF